MFINAPFTSLEYAACVQNQAVIGRTGKGSHPLQLRGKNLMCTLMGDGSLDCKNMFLGPCGKGFKVRNQATAKLKLQPLLGVGVRKVDCSQGRGWRVLLIAPGQGKGRGLGTCVAEARSARTRCWSVRVG